jgi:hypothetical protein
MPEFTITISSALLAKLQALAATYNSNNGTNLTVKQWLKVELIRSATQEDLSKYIQRRQEEIQAAGNQALTAEIEAEQLRLNTEME